MWKWRNLSLLGKIKIVKTFAIPKLMFRASVTLISSDVVQEANSIFYNFIWKSKNAAPVTNHGYCYFPLFHFSFWEAKMVYYLQLSRLLSLENDQKTLTEEWTYIIVDE